MRRTKKKRTNWIFELFIGNRMLTDSRALQSLMRLSPVL
jgi:hypothetical protein